MQGTHGREPVTAAEPGETLTVLSQFNLQPLHLESQLSVFLIGGFRRLLQLLDLVLQVPEMLLLAFTERPLRSTVLSLSFLQKHVSWKEHDSADDK